VPLITLFSLIVLRATSQQKARSHTRRMRPVLRSTHISTHFTQAHTGPGTRELLWPPNSVPACLVLRLLMLRALPASAFPPSQRSTRARAARATCPASCRPPRSASTSTKRSRSGATPRAWLRRVWPPRLRPRRARGRRLVAHRRREGAQLRRLPQCALPPTALRKVVRAGV